MLVLRISEDMRLEKQRNPAKIFYVHIFHSPTLERIGIVFYSQL